MDFTSFLYKIKNIDRLAEKHGESYVSPYPPPPKRVKIFQATCEVPKMWVLLAFLSIQQTITIMMVVFSFNRGGKVGVVPQKCFRNSYNNNNRNKPLQTIRRRTMIMFKYMFYNSHLNLTFYCNYPTLLHVIIVCYISVFAPLLNKKGIGWRTIRVIRLE